MLSEADRTTALLGNVGSLSSSAELVGGLYAYAGTQFGSAAYNEVIATADFAVEAGIVAVVPGGSLFVGPITDAVDFSSVQVEGVDPAIAGMVMVGGMFLPGPGSGEARLADGAADLAGDLVTSPGAQDLLTGLGRGADEVAGGAGAVTSRTINDPAIRISDSVTDARQVDAAEINRGFVEVDYRPPYDEAMPVRELTLTQDVTLARVIPEGGADYWRLVATGRRDRGAYARTDPRPVRAS